MRNSKGSEPVVWGFPGSHSAPPPSLVPRLRARSVSSSSPQGHGPGSCDSEPRVGPLSPITWGLGGRAQHWHAAPREFQGLGQEQQMGVKGQLVDLLPVRGALE